MSSLYGCVSDHSTLNIFGFLLNIMLQDWSGQNASSIASEICGFITVLSGTIILHSTREQEPASASGMLTKIS